MISVNDALEKLFALASELAHETVPISQASGRVLAAKVTANITQPPFSSSAMDGYAVISEDVESGKRLKVIGESAAGSRFDGCIKHGETIRIFTGAPVPDGADRIVIQEDITRDGNTITIGDTVDAKAYVRPAGGDFHKGDKFTGPIRLNPSDIALLASMNVPTVEVTKKPVVALIPTGNELVMPGETPGPDQIISSNNFGLKALLEEAGAEVRMLPIARDTLDSLNQVFDLAQGADLIVTLGGASVGDHDLVHRVATDRGMGLDFYKVAMQPGKPLMAGNMGDTPMVGLPGNPVSSLVCGHIFLRPMIDVMLGFEPAALPRHTGQIAGDMPSNGKREHYMRAVATIKNGTWVVTPFERQDSSLLTILRQANVLLVRPPNDAPLTKGATVEFVQIR